MEIVYLQQDDPYTTLTTWIYKAFWMMHRAEELGKTPYINWHENGGFLQPYHDRQKFKETPNAYDWYFKQPFIDNPTGSHETWTWEKNKWGANIDDENILMYKSVPEIKEYFKKHLHFNDAVNARGNELVTKYDIDFSKTIGVTWRGTDIYLESENGNKGRKYFPIETYFKWIDKALEEIPDARIACTAEEESILEPLFKRYPQAFLIEEFYQSPKGGKLNPERIMPGRGYERGLQPALMVWLFSKCAWYIKVRSSMAAIASWISDGKIVSIGHSEGLYYENPDEWSTKVEFQGVKYPI